MCIVLNVWYSHFWYFNLQRWAYGLHRLFIIFIFVTIWVPIHVILPSFISSCLDKLSRIMNNDHLQGCILEILICYAFCLNLYIEADSTTCSIHFVRKKEWNSEINTIAIARRVSFYWQQGTEISNHLQSIFWRTFLYSIYQCDNYNR